MKNILGKAGPPLTKYPKVDRCQGTSVDRIQNLLQKVFIKMLAFVLGYDWTFISGGGISLFHSFYFIHFWWHNIALKYHCVGFIINQYLHINIKCNQREDLKVHSKWRLGIEKCWFYLKGEGKKLHGWKQENQNWYKTSLKLLPDQESFWIPVWHLLCENAVENLWRLMSKENTFSLPCIPYIKCCFFSTLKPYDKEKTVIPGCTMKMHSLSFHHC